MVSACCWESTSLRITLAIDSFVYFANVRYDYPWCYFAGTIVYAYRNHEESVTDITFWNIKKNEVFIFKLLQTINKIINNFLPLDLVLSYKIYIPVVYGFLQRSLCSCCTK